MDYEWRIMLLEKDLAHYREMQTLVRERLDTHDQHLDGINRYAKGTNERLPRAAGAPGGFDRKGRSVNRADGRACGGSHHVHQVARKGRERNRRDEGVRSKRRSGTVCAARSSAH